MKHGVIIGTRTIGETGYLDGAVEVFPDNQFVDLAMIGFVREATEEEVAAALQPPTIDFLAPEGAAVADVHPVQAPSPAGAGEAPPADGDDPK